ncbi:NAD(P)H-binding protein [Fibrella sp. HMF5335]|uniref:NAD(P)H-binding protein n=1 Tax=Fibrella rubiginis TaxID=2817060 RepID=A0A939GGB8_9BACT|nr:NAD(P)H-binding protein [Fibrella rubiginis]MBO0937258.1 NAD(P)H-binding protein [Fibrella rubiginis]
MTSIAFIGATGLIGKPVANELITAGFSVRIVARDVAAAKRLFPAADVVFGDLQKPESLHNALVGCAVVYLNLSVKQTEKPVHFHTETDGSRHLLVAAKGAGVTRVAYLSSVVMRYQGMNGFDWWVFRIKHEAVALIKASGLDYSIFYPSNFMETMLATQAVGPLVLVLGHSVERPWFVSACDYGRQVARALQIAQPGGRQEYVIQGPEAVDQLSAARRLVAHLPGAKRRVISIPMTFLALGRHFSQQADYGYHIGEALNQYPERFEADHTWADLGKPESTIELFASCNQ